MSSIRKFTIIVDGRENTDVAYDFDDFPVGTERTNIETGDYSIEGYEDRFAVERKSISDLANCCGVDYDHFEKQLFNGEDLDEFAVVVEGTRDDVEEANYWSDVHPNAVLGTVDYFQDDCDIEFVFARDEKDAQLKTFQLLNEWYDSA